MAAKRKLSPAQIRQAAQDRRQGITWKGLSLKYNVAINTIRKALSEYSREFTPINQLKRSELEERLRQAESEIHKIKAQLKKRFNLHI